MKSPVKRSSKEVVEKRTARLRAILLSARHERSLEALLSDLLTPYELTSLAERVAILERLARGATLREVARSVGVSLSKVERGSHVIQYGKADWNKIAATGR